MKSAVCNLLEVSPHGIGFPKIHFSRSAVLLLVMAFVLSFCAAVFVMLTFPRVRVDEAHHSRLVQVHHDFISHRASGGGGDMSDSH
jgi:hypothetical protein